MKVRTFVTAIALGLMAQVAVVALHPVSARAQQNPAMKDDIEQFAMDLHVGMERSSMTPQQKEQMRGDLKGLRAAHQNHEPMKEMESMRRLKAMVDNTFSPQDKERIHQDLEAIRAARGGREGGGGMLR